MESSGTDQVNAMVILEVLVKVRALVNVKPDVTGPQSIVSRST